MSLFASIAPKRVANFVLALLLAVSTLTASLPFIFSNTAEAAPNTVVTGSGFGTLTNWENDRSAPSGGFTLNNANLTLNVDGDTPAISGQEAAFYRTEGRKAELPAGTNTIKATLNVDAAWENTIGVRAGIWAETVTTPTVYPILEFSNRNDLNDQLPGTAVIRAWDSNNGWVNLINNPVYGQSYTFEVAHNPYTDTFDYYVNDILYRSVATTYAGVSHGPFSKVIFNSYNSRIAGNDYSVVWSNFQTNVFAPNTAPVVSFNDPTPADDAPVSGTINASVTASDDYGMGSYYVRFWKDSFESGVLLGECSSAPGAFLLGTTETVECSLDTSLLTDGTKVVLSAQFQDGSIVWGSAMRTFTVDALAPTAPVITHPSGWHLSVDNVQWSASVDTSDVTYALYEGNHPSNVNTLIQEGIIGTTVSHDFAPGPHFIRVVATDAVGHETSSSVVGFQVIGTPEITAPTEGYTITSGNSFTATWTPVYGVGGNKNYEIEYGVDRNNDGDYADANEIAYRLVSGNTLERTQEFTTNFQGNMTIRVRAIYNIPMGGSDKGEWSTLVNYSRDTIAPIVTITGFTALDNVITPIVTTDDENVTYSWTANNIASEGVAISNPTAKQPNFTVDGTIDGTYSFTLLTTDQAGHTDSDLFNFTYTAPVVEDEEEEVAQPPAAGSTGGQSPAPTAFTGVFTNGGAVLGVTTDETADNEAAQNGEADVAGATTDDVAAIDTDATDGSIFGLAWYWWLLILAALAAITSMIVAAVRRRTDEQA